MSVKIHPTADVQSQNIAEGTQILQYCVILSDLVIGSNCNITCQVLLRMML